MLTLTIDIASHTFFAFTYEVDAPNYKVSGHYAPHQSCGCIFFFYEIHEDVPMIKYLIDFIH
jgi:hypothetical protein